MPVYMYRCRNCGVRFRKTQTFAGKPLKRCPACRTGTLRRVPQLPAIAFKGSGWYSTDHRAALSPPAPASPSSPEPNALSAKKAGMANL